MRVKTLNINNLRNISKIHIELESGLNCFIGENGAGKTSILESLVVLSKGRSFRSGQITSLIGPDDSHFQIVAKVKSSQGSEHQLGLERGTDYWTARHNGEDVKQLSEITRLLPHVMLEPNSHTLISGPPDGRRKYLDWSVFHVKHDFLLLWRRFNRVLKQRNAALRQSERSVVDSLDPQFVKLGACLHQARMQHAGLLAEGLEKKLLLFNKTLSDIEISYRKGWQGDDLAVAIEQSYRRDSERGATGPGPHKADLHITLDGAPAKERLSRGEQKALTAAMIMAQAELICNLGEQPVLLLDDLSSELDEEHQERILHAALSLGVQIWVTGTALSPAIAACGSDYAVFHVKHGGIEA